MRRAKEHRLIARQPVLLIQQETDAWHNRVKYTVLKRLSSSMASIENFCNAVSSAESVSSCTSRCRPFVLVQFLHLRLVLTDNGLHQRFAQSIYRLASCSFASNVRTPNIGKNERSGVHARMRFDSRCSRWASSASTLRHPRVFRSVSGLERAQVLGGSMCFCPRSTDAKGRKASSKCSR